MAYMERGMGDMRQPGQLWVNDFATIPTYVANYIVTSTTATGVWTDHQGSIVGSRRFDWENFSLYTDIFQEDE